MVEPAKHCGVLVMRGAMVAQATVGKAPEVLDLWQQQHGAGPCFDAASQQRIIMVADTARERRWAGFGGAGVTQGVSSMLCVPLWVEDQCLGALSLYAQESNPFSDHHIRLTRLLATHAALALADANRAEHLRVALVNRDVIGASPASPLSTCSSSLRRPPPLKLIAVAQHLVDTGELRTDRPRKLPAGAAG